MWLCKDCRVKLGFEEYDEWKDPFENGWGKERSQSGISRMSEKIRRV